MSLRREKNIQRYLVSHPISPGASKFIANIITGDGGLSFRMVTMPIRTDNSEFAAYVRQVECGSTTRHFLLKRKHINGNLVEIKDDLDRSAFLMHMQNSKDFSKLTISKQRLAFAYFKHHNIVIPNKKITEMLCELDIYRTKHDGLIILNILTDDDTKFDMDLEFTKYPFSLFRIKRKLQDHEFTINYLINNSINSGDI
jgi:hypothetical protein